MGVFAILLLLPIIIQHLTVKIDRVNLQRKKQGVINDNLPLSEIRHIAIESVCEENFFVN